MKNDLSQAEYDALVRDAMKWRKQLIEADKLSAVSENTQNAAPQAESPKGTGSAVAGQAPAVAVTSSVGSAEATTADPLVTLHNDCFDACQMDLRHGKGPCPYSCSLIYEKLYARSSAPRTWTCYRKGGPLSEPCGRCDCLQGMPATRTAPADRIAELERELEESKDHEASTRQRLESLYSANPTHAARLQAERRGYRCSMDDSELCKFPACRCEDVSQPDSTREGP